jgi:hypothetical protein
MPSGHIRLRCNEWLLVRFRSDATRRVQQASRHDLARALAPRYAHASRREKGQLLDEFCEITQYTRKHALVLLSDPPAEDRPRHVGGRPLSYGPAEVALLRMCWSATDGICSKRLGPFLPELLERGTFAHRRIGSRVDRVRGLERLRRVTMLLLAVLLAGLLLQLLSAGGLLRP